MKKINFEDINNDTELNLQSDGKYTLQEIREFMRDKDLTNDTAVQLAFRVLENTFERIESGEIRLDSLPSHHMFYTCRDLSNGMVLANKEDNTSSKK